MSYRSSTAEAERLGDYDAALRDRPASQPPTLVAGPPRRVVVRLHEWDGPDSRLHTVRFLFLAEQPAAGFHQPVMTAIKPGADWSDGMVRV